ncbi:glutathione S-transferase TCHQD [Rhodamnia argentea]|uniref:Glutathione S-transferase TCHQD n=1 Tax=Rhodamnia argentea TaxID=178133 RepID=A0A8B8QDN2_9MYRT|nr:glutathione S-transferase TCHQD [Rhodamnia argentea]
MQLYHHPYSLDSQKVRLALEEKGIDYTSFHVNPITGKNLRPSFFRMNPTARLPVFQNGSHVIFDTIEIIQYIERIALVSVGSDGIAFSSDEVIKWMHKIQEWNPKFFTLSHVPEKYRQAVSKFLRRVLIARMAESHDLASSYHRKLKEAYDTEEKLRDPDVVRRSKEHLIRLLDEIEDKLNETAYIAGEEFSMADVMLMPVLARLALLNLEDEYINSRPNMAKYWSLVQQRPSYKKVIGRYFGSWRKYKTLAKTWCFIRLRSTLKKY